MVVPIRSDEDNKVETGEKQKGISVVLLNSFYILCFLTYSVNDNINVSIMLNYFKYNILASQHKQKTTDLY